MSFIVHEAGEILLKHIT